MLQDAKVPMWCRRGFSLLELLVVFLIAAVAIGMLLVAIQNVKNQSLRAESANHIRQLILGFHQLSDTESGRVKGLPQSPNINKQIYKDESLFMKLLPYISGDRQLPSNPSSGQILDFLTPRVKVFISPGDPSLSAGPAANMRTLCSYPCNMFSFDGIALFPVSIPDGTANTMAFAEHYFYSGSNASGEEYLGYDYIFSNVLYPNATYAGLRRATFADQGWGDVLPVTDVQTKLTGPSVPGVTFQVRPRVEEANPRILQTPFSSGLNIALFDGSVRTLSPRIEEHVFWALVTPNGGEVAGDF
jgi:type II secretory pathway pseudopilin PulG